MRGHKYRIKIWLFFPGNFPAISDDLVNSYHLLLCCIDWFYSNAIMSNRSDLLISSFSGIMKFLNLSLLLLSFSILAQLFFLSNEICINSLLVSGLPKNFHESDFKPPYEVPCIIQLLCDKHDGIGARSKRYQGTLVQTIYQEDIRQKGMD